MRAEVMTYGRFLKKNWTFAGMVIILIAAHRVMFYHLISHMA